MQKRFEYEEFHRDTISFISLVFFFGVWISCSYCICLANTKGCLICRPNFFAYAFGFLGYRLLLHAQHWTMWLALVSHSMLATVITSMLVLLLSTLLQVLAFVACGFFGGRCIYRQCFLIGCLKWIVINECLQFLQISQNWTIDSLCLHTLQCRCCAHHIFIFFVSLFF